MKPRKPQAPRIDWRRVDGILLLDKPQGLSSNQALQAARRLFRAEKGGHTGALDPLATGLLPLCFGEATKVAGRLLGGVKRYRTVARLGARAETTLFIDDKPENVEGARAAGLHAFHFTGAAALRDAFSQAGLLTPGDVVPLADGLLVNVNATFAS